MERGSLPISITHAYEPRGSAIDSASGIRDLSPIPGVLLSEITVSDRALFETSRHETLHGLIDPSLVLGVSVEPEADSLGHITVRYVSDIMAAAGIVHGEGYGHDESQIRGSKETAVSLARSKLSQYPDDVIRLVSCGVMRMKTLSGDQFRSLISQAYRELNIPEISIFTQYTPDETPRYATITTYEGRDDIRVVEDGKETKRIVVCRACGGVEGNHALDCRYRKMASPDEYEQEEAIDDFPREEIIFPNQSKK